MHHPIENPKAKTVGVAIAILHRQGQFLLQLRDDFPHIIYPGHWGLFGGHLEPQETPEEALKRELLEEINYSVSNPVAFGIYPDEKAVRHVYHAPLTVPLEQLILREGADFSLVSPADIEKGTFLSPKLGELRPLGKIHKKILLDFINSFQNFVD